MSAWHIHSMRNYVHQKLNAGFTAFGHRIFQENPGVISQDACWVCFYNIHETLGAGGELDSLSCYGHFNNSLFGLVKELIFEHGHDKHMVGY